jgi:hypothetical protein
LGAIFQPGLITSRVANWLNFRPHNSKGAGKNYVQPNKLAAEFLSNIRQKSPKKGQNFFLVLSFDMLSKRKKIVLKYIISLFVLYLAVVSQLSKILFELLYKKNRDQQ